MKGPPVYPYRARVYAPNGRPFPTLHMLPASGGWVQMPRSSRAGVGREPMKPAARLMAENVSFTPGAKFACPRCAPRSGLKSAHLSGARRALSRPGLGGGSRKRSKRLYGLLSAKFSGKLYAAASSRAGGSGAYFGCTIGGVGRVARRLRWRAAGRRER
jgi:hypothetical protein